MPAAIIATPMTARTPRKTYSLFQAVRAAGETVQGSMLPGPTVPRHIGRRGPANTALRTLPADSVSPPVNTRTRSNT